MNGDTLEFNADAFHLDPNAVAEDLLRKLPGVVVWGDGTITVHGREVSRVLVNGKPFFGGDTKVATQNLPKKAVEKVQVYQQSKNKDNPLDSITEVNIQLKKAKR
ncbi:Plug domain-containing protein [Arachidicoccus ginsenosidivorans]|uniref:Plug domain-containing protein n=1 Tax=Arachidicoccus ginsenosidivorans TaxID=496057 RepID=A0A5B8VTP5_9BACT|nr:Plug domain-containing protein [Arachidicoccus ginsenosidivorans]QEC73518.1 Plug domain-containing protein [Arachidicoccus ginsenosidivorans]